MAKMSPLLNRFIAICWLLGIFTSLTACNGTLEVNLSLEPAQPKPNLGKVAYIAGGDLWILDLDNQQSTRLTRDGYNISPGWAASGRYLAFLKRGQLWVIEISTQKASRIDQAPVEWFEWAPHGDRLAFYSRQFGLVAWDPNFETAVSLLSNSPGTTQENFSWGADGSVLFFNKGSTTNGKYAVSLESIQVDTQTTHTLFASNDLGAIPRLGMPSPDSLYLAYWNWDTITPFAEEGGLQVCILDLQTNQPDCTDIKTDPVPEAIAWSNDGELALIGKDPLAISEGLVAVKASAGSINNLLTFNNRSPLYPNWSPDGKFIAISAKAPGQTGGNGSPAPTASIPGRRLWIVNAENGSPSQLTRDPLFSDERPIFSLDGSQLLFARLDEESASLWMISTNGSNLHQIVPELTPRPEPAGQSAIMGWSELWEWWQPEDQ